MIKSYLPRYNCACWSHINACYLSLTMTAVGQSYLPSSKETCVCSWAGSYFAHCRCTLIGHPLISYLYCGLIICLCCDCNTSSSLIFVLYRTMDHVERVMVHFMPHPILFCVLSAWKDMFKPTVDKSNRNRSNLLWSITMSINRSWTLYLLLFLYSCYSCSITLV